ncbi:MAG: hypothetical protein CVU56_08035 [Deltaproteobacteria bacterium HGW-Deltaproteobacteria-14]|jgi:long-subunit acyl-CoA synthetase (AMP-forming)/GNAT superfamily N-acetyltransferase|nr:MAG: hypothetical protein CVU56_08035 [Deltaproteobacteria bacterium HGW-Deltaproteobacteria-14]
MPTTTLAAAAADVRAVLARGGAPAAHALNALLARLASDPAVDVVSEGASGLDILEETLFALRHRGLERLLGGDLDLDAVTALGRRLVGRLAAFPRHPALERAAWAWLDLARRAPIPRLVAERGQSDAFFALELALIEASRFTVGRLFAQRVETYGTRTLFRVPSRGPAGQYSWLDVASRASLVARGLLALLDGRGAGPVALVSENRFELALIDLACLAHGVVTAMIPPDTTPDDLLDILAAGQIAVCVVSNANHLVRLDFSRAPTVHSVVVIDRPPTRGHGVLTLAEVERQGAAVPETRLAAHSADLDADSLATVMYTSGTSGRPKGIRFTQRCLVSKRFARGLALPSVDEGGVFLAYLPLYHTFGRYLEMLGSVFWGATYVFAEDTSVDALVDAFRAFRPTVFISIPLKWVQIHEHIGQLVDLASAPDDEIARTVRAVVGDRLTVGLSAAGYLDPSVFRFFQRYGVDLNSGFGMTEGTGGLLMTPPGRYRDDSLGVPLPGTEARLADDGELLVRGAYVTPGYVDPEHDAVAWTDDRWLKTGDVMEQDADGFFRIVDRKKDIFKNVKGETIAPQRVERLFSEIEAVKRFVLIGDHRPFNTGLIVPNLDVPRPDLRAMDPEELHEYFRPHVVTANRFLAPFERVVDFAVLPRDFDAERGELTPKGTLRRRSIEDAFSSEIESLYNRGQRVTVDGVDIALRLPSWLFQSLGVTVSGVEAVAGALRVGATGRLLAVADRGRGPDGRRRLRIGSSVYAVDGDVLDLGVVLQTPALWLGNEALLGFVSVGTRRRMRRGLPPRGVALVGREAAHTPSQDERAALARALGEAQPGLAELETGASLVGADDGAVAVGAVTLIGRVLACQPGQLGALALTVLRAAASLPDLEVRRAALRVLLPAERGERAAATLARFSPGLETLLDGPTRASLASGMLSDDALDAVATLASARAEATEGDPASSQAEAEALSGLLADYGAAHPARYRQARRGLAAIEAFALDDAVKAAARRERARMTECFRAWVGPTAALAVDPETGAEYGWTEVVAFDDEIAAEERERLLDALRDTALIHETLFLLYDGASVRLSDIPPGGVWISRRWREPWRSVYRATVHTRFRGHYDLAIKLDHGPRAATLDEEQLWLLIVGDHVDRVVAARQGGRWPERGIWTEQFQGTRRANWQIERLHQRGKLAEAWPAICWGVGKVCCDVWDAMGRRFVPGDLRPENFAIPGEDYKTGSRLASAAKREPYRGIAALLDDFERGFVAPVRAAYPEVRGETPWEAVLTGLVEVVGVSDGLALLGTVADTAEDAVLARAASAFAAQIERHGFVPRQLLHAIDRYRSWADLAGDATAEARATMVQELCRTYQLGALRHAYPEARTRLFRATVLARVPDWVGRQLDVMIDELRTGAIPAEALTERVGLLRGAPGAEPELEYFLARLGYPHLEPGDDATLLSGESHGLGVELVVALEDADGRPYQVRPPVNPKELAALHRLYLGADIQVAFQAHHRFMLAVDERGGVLGGMYYALDLETRVCHLEKVVVTEARRGRGVGDGLMVELFKRLMSAGYNTVTTGFYRRGYFYRLGFQVEGRHPGLVKHLDG